MVGFDREFFLAGGLQAENLTEAMEAVRPYAVDLSSGIESDRKKDPEKMRRMKRNTAAWQISGKSDN